MQTILCLFVLLALVAVVFSQAHSFFTVPGSSSRSSGSSSSGSSSRRPSSSGRRSSSSSSRPSSSRSQSSKSSPSPSSGPAIHGEHGNSIYHYSFKINRGQKFSGSAAASYCRKLGSGWNAVSINSAAENKFIIKAIGGTDYIWTSGRRAGGKTFKWADGTDTSSFTDWGKTGGKRPAQPQPDNRDGNEDCLSILNKFYPRDGITWHDVGCNHKKPTICEKSN